MFYALRSASCWSRFAHIQNVYFASANNALAKHFRFFSFFVATTRLPGPCMCVMLHTATYSLAQKSILNWVQTCVSTVGRSNTFPIQIALASVLTHICEQCLSVWVCVSRLSKIKYLYVNLSRRIAFTCWAVRHANDEDSESDGKVCRAQHSVVYERRYVLMTFVCGDDSNDSSEIIYLICGMQFYFACGQAKKWLIRTAYWTGPPESIRRYFDQHSHTYRRTKCIFSRIVAVSDYGFVIIIILLLTVPMCKIICQNVDSNKLLNVFRSTKNTVPLCSTRKCLWAEITYTHLRANVGRRIRYTIYH